VAVVVVSCVEVVFTRTVLVRTVVAGMVVVSRSTAVEVTVSNVL
jgi:hypothetical protein